MRLSIRIAGGLVAVLCATGNAHSAGDQNPGDCRLEPVVVEEGISSYQYSGFSPDGKTLAIGWDDGGERRGTYLLDLESGDRVDVPEFNNGATFSPDGRKLLNSVFVEDAKTEMLEVDLATRERVVIAPHPEWDWLPTYSPSGRQIIFNSYRTGGSDLYLLELETGELRRLTTDERYEAHAQLSPGGRRVVFHRQDGGADYNLYLMELATGEQIPLTDSPAEESYGSWAPDGRHIAFSSDRDGEAGETDIYVMTDEGEIVARLTADAAKDAQPFFSPDGEHVYFNSYREPQGVYRVRVDDAFRCPPSDRP